jgi:hypothetical protein
VAGGGEDGVGVIAVASLEVIAVEMTLWLEVSDHGLDGGPAPQLR